jgi:DUF1680 family protein
MCKYSSAANQPPTARRRKRVRRALLVISAALFCISAAARAEEPQATDKRAPINLALLAQASSSFTSGDTSVAALNDGHQPRNSRDASHGSYGNWNHTGTEWVEYEWSQPIRTDRIEVYWWADGRGVGVPASARLLYWNGDEFVPLEDASPIGVATNRFNAGTFQEVTTSKLRLEIKSDGKLSTGILEWKVYDSGKSPKFPLPVIAGVDRIVVLGGKTYLSGTIKKLRNDSDNEAVEITWSKESGPGDVTFANPKAIETTAAFSKVGKYVLKLTARDDDLSGSSQLHVSVEAPPPQKPLRPVYTRPYKIDGPFWRDRFKSIICQWIPHCIEQIENPNLRTGQGGIDNFIEAAKKLAGQPHSPHKGYVFSNAWVHQTVEAICLALMVDPQGDAEIKVAHEKMKSTLEDWIPKILAAQEPDGYLQTAFTLDERKRRWSPEFRGDHEGYIAGYFIESAINHYMLTNGSDRRLYHAAKKLADCWVAHIGPEPGKQLWFDGHQEMEMALVRFGRFVNDKEGPGNGDAYIRLARFLLDCRRGGSEYDQSHLPVQQQYEAVGHAVRAVYSYAGMADIALETGDSDYRSAVMSLWDNLINKKYYVTGGIGSGESPEGFGANYSLPHRAYCEACSSCGEIFFQHKMNLAYHEARYADLYEETIFNALLGAMDRPGKNFYYDNPLVGDQPRYPWHDCPCCVGNIPRTLLMMPTWTYATDADAIFVNMFIDSTIQVNDVAGTDVEMVQKTDYPWSGRVSINVNPAEAKDFAIHVRAPNRSVSELYSSSPDAKGILSLAVNGERMPIKIEEGYVAISRTWGKGDTIEIELPMTVQRIKCIDDVAANRGHVALRRGPLVYSIEAIDGNNMDGILDPESVLRTQWRPDLLGGVMTIRGSFTDGSPLVALPNYARNNRLWEPRQSGRQSTTGHSKVWIKDQDE